MNVWTPTRSFGLEDTRSRVASNNKSNHKRHATISINESHGETKVIDDRGNEIINYSADKEWFFKNITFVFGIGRIFDELDTSDFDKILQCFNTSPNKAYLLNDYHVNNYDDAIIKAIEEYYKISDGNYHLLMALINSADSETLERSPIDELKHNGVVVCCTSWKSIKQTFNKYVSLFGFLSEHIEKFKSSRIRQNMYDINKGSCFDMSKNIEDIKIEQKTHIFKGIPSFVDVPETDIRGTLNVVTNQRTGIHENMNVKQQNTASTSLLNRIAHENKNNTLPPLQKGGMLKMNERFQPIDAREPELKLFNDTGAYDETNGTNILENVNPSMRGDIPNLSTKNMKSKSKKYIDSGIFIFPK